MSKINLNELTLERYDQWPAPVKYGVTAGLALLMILVSYCLLIKSNCEQLDSLRKQELTLKADFASKQYQASNVQAHRDQLQSTQNRFATMLQQLPAQNEMPGLLDELSKTGLTAGLKFELFAPQAEVPHDFYLELPIKIRVIGHYLQLVDFLSRIAQLSRVVTLHEFNIAEPAAQDDKTNAAGELVMDITAKIYRYRAP